jgi:hypothetical protein
MHINLKKEKKDQKIEEVLKNNLKKRKVFLKKIKKKLKSTK